MAYGQKNYLQTIGINGKYRIDQVGCFLTAFSNLLERYGRGINPVDLNAAFVQRGVYIDVDDGIRDDLAWGSITSFDPSIHVTRWVQKGISDHSAGWPSTNNAIVRFYYRSFSQPTLSNGQPNMIVHFALVADVSARTIVDSWDGVTKPNPYGDPTGWAEYDAPIAAPVTPPPAPSTPSVNNAPIDGETYTVQKGDSLWAIASRSGTDWHVLAEINGIKDASKINIGQVINLGRPPAPTPTPSPAPSADTYVVVAGDSLWQIAKDRGLDYHDLARINGIDDPSKIFVGQVIKLREAVAPAPAPEPPKSDVKPELAPMPIPEGEPVKVKVEVDAYKKSYRDEPAEVQALEDAVVQDMDGKLASQQLVKGQIVHQAGLFIKAGKTYSRTLKSVENGLWYGIPTEALGPIDDDSADAELAKEGQELFRNLTTRKQLVASIASIEGFLFKILSIFKLKRK